MSPEMHPNGWQMGMSGKVHRAIVYAASEDGCLMTFAGAKASGISPN
jgi:hypothetical protein